MQRIVWAKLLGQEGVVSLYPEMGLRMPTQSKLAPHPRVHEITADEVSDGVIRKSRIEEIADFQSCHGDADRQGEIEESLADAGCRGLRCCGHADQFIGTGGLAEDANRALRSA